MLEDGFQYFIRISFNNLEIRLLSWRRGLREPMVVPSSHATVVSSRYHGFFQLSGDQKACQDRGDALPGWNFGNTAGQSVDSRAGRQSPGRSKNVHRVDSVGFFGLLLANK
ncbi:hypothetical protein DYH09_14110 [bacterium CPR1]|nr:hypothetical protein [bacterium CPR1]